MNRSVVNRVLAGVLSIDTCLHDALLHVEGSKGKEKLEERFSLLDKFNLFYNIVTPAIV